MFQRVKLLEAAADDDPYYTSLSYSGVVELLCCVILEVIHTLLLLL